MRRHHRRNPEGKSSILPLVLIGGAAFLLLRGGGLGTSFGSMVAGVNSPTPPPGTIVPAGYTWVQGQGVVPVTMQNTLLSPGVVSAAVGGLTALLKNVFSGGPSGQVVPPGGGWGSPTIIADSGGAVSAGAPPDILAPVDTTPVDTLPVIDVQSALWGV